MGEDTGGWAGYAPYELEPPRCPVSTDQWGISENSTGHFFITRSLLVTPLIAALIGTQCERRNVRSYVALTDIIFTDALRSADF